MRSFRRVLALLTTCLALALAGCGFVDPPTVKVTERPAEGLRESDFNGAYLTALEAWTREAAAERLERRYEGNAVPGERREAGVETASRYWEYRGRRLALVTLAYRGTPVRVLRVSGLVGEALVTVSCTSPQGSQLDPADTATACGKTVARVFGAE